VGLQTSDDAAVYRLSDELAMVQTVDFFPPVVDDPYVYGAIAAANAMSDIFAMGGDVLFALNIAAWPDNQPLKTLSRIFEGGADKAAEAGIVIAGGHTITDDEPKYGLVVTGAIDPQRILTKAGAKPGDLVFLTKPLGTGAITTAIKQDAADPEHAELAIASMLRLNQQASRLAREAGIHSCTDVTGFGLLGHATEMAIKSGVGMELESGALPWLPGTERYAAEGRLPGGMTRNRDFYAQLPECGVTFQATVSQTIQELMFNPETSGGLLIAVPKERAEALTTAFAGAGHGLWRIGRVTGGRSIHVS
jgi:selenide,water dikinase